jgi:hypothetical protein
MQQVLDFTIGDEVKIVTQPLDGDSFKKFVDEVNTGWIKVRTITIFNKRAVAEVRTPTKIYYDPDTQFGEVFLQSEKKVSPYTSETSIGNCFTLPLYYVRRSAPYSDGLENWI